ncbi:MULTISPECIES: glutathione S-transferase family protein [unclassified Rhizobacter]|uniref:glutathione S-transferase family protein n=1 Tax=unclassified Rhizobacter TaxID=2640088 RepID=UPI000701F77C|nr:MULTISPECIES: glutathione S-transferase family protein [unclassified Rhizobacter]KQU78245.1 glutathione S-transferase [Rhizobacter sp. Root29]KQW15991.1 glutathione S-transferase [Rhizobacter sp. Root1238]KRB25109.1 glutathione S-transferase [Rhizobacter sp. Root16D2]
MIQLYYFPGNASMAPHMLLEELGIPFELVRVEREKGALRSPEYLKLNPNGLIPVLVDGELVLYEAAAICLHLLDAHPQSGLAPAVGTPQRAHFYKWLMWLTNSLQPALITYFYPDRYVRDADAVPQVKDCAEARVGALVDLLEAELASHGKPWLLGDAFSAIDLYALMLCRWTRGFHRPARTLPALGAHLQRVLARPAVQRMLASEGLQPPLV